MECVKNPSYNCEKNKQKYSDNYECCSQYGNEDRLGIFVKKGQCDKTRGLPIKGCKDPDNKFTPKESYENFTTVVKEGYEDDCCCTNWNSAFIVLIIVFSLLGFLGVLWYMRDVKIR